MKKKKKLIIILSSISGVIILLSFILVGCTALTLIPPMFEDTEATDTLEISTHLSPEEPNATDTEEETELVITEAVQTEISESEENTTEETTEEESETPVESLEFRSNGNGTCAVVGIGTVTDSYVSIPLKSPEGDVVTSISKKAFFGNEQLKAIEIPSTVSDIGEMAFSGCPKLIYISVNDDNKNFKDEGGILYNSDMTQLIAFPASNGASTITIPFSLRSIAPMAFYGCTNLKVINFEGTMDEWSKISRGDMNYGLYHVSVICSDTTK